MSNTDPLLTGEHAARRVGIAAATWRSYVARGYAPKPDVPDLNAPTNRANPRWLTSTVDQYIATRPGQGARTDRKAAS